VQIAHHTSPNTSPITTSLTQHGCDNSANGRPATGSLVRRLRLLSTLESHSHGTGRIVLEARVALLVRTIVRAA